MAHIEVPEAVLAEIIQYGNQDKLTAELITNEPVWKVFTKYLQKFLESANITTEEYEQFYRNTIKKRPSCFNLRQYIPGGVKEYLPLDAFTELKQPELFTVFYFPIKRQQVPIDAVWWEFGGQGQPRNPRVWVEGKQSFPIELSLTVKPQCLPLVSEKMIDFFETVNEYYTEQHSVMQQRVSKRMEFLEKRLAAGVPGIQWTVYQQAGSARFAVRAYLGRVTAATIELRDRPLDKLENSVPDIIHHVQNYLNAIKYGFLTFS